MADVTTTSTSTMPSWVQPYAAGYLQRAQAVADQPFTQYQGQTVAGFTPWQQQGLQAQAARAAEGSPTMGAANANLQSVLNGSFLGANPYLDAQVQAAQGDLVSAWNKTAVPQWSKAMQSSGSFGNTGVMAAQYDAANALQQNLGRVAGDMRYNAYNQERQNQMSALGMAPTFAQQDYNDINQLQSAGQAYQAQQQKELDAQYQQWKTAQQYPQQQLDVMRNALGGVNFGNTTTNTQPGASTASQVLGGITSGLGLYDLIFGKP